MKRLSLLLLFICISSVFGLHAITLQQCQSLAREHYPLIRQYGILHSSEAFTLDAATKAWLPQVTLGAQATWQNHVPSFPDVLSNMLAAQGVDMKGMMHEQFRVQAEVGQLIWDGGRIKASKAVAAATTDEQRATLDVELNQVEQRVNDLYFSILLMQQQLKSIGLAEMLFNTNLTRMRTLYTEGVATKSDCDAIEAELLGINQQKSSVDSQINCYKQLLTLFIGQELDNNFVIPQPIDSNAATDQSLRPSLARFSAMEKTTFAQEEELKTSLLPQVSAFGQAFYGYPGFNSMEAMVNRSLSFNMLIGVKAQWNLTPRYTQKHRLAQLQLRRDMIAAQREAFLFNNQIESTQASNEIKRIKALQADDQRIIQLRSNVRKSSEAKLNEGIIVTSELLQRINDEHAARINADIHSIEILKAIYQLQYITSK